MSVNLIIQFITKWIKNYALNSSENQFNLIVGVSGGIDSALVSTLCAETGILTHVVSMPIKQNSEQHELSLGHIKWLKSNYSNITSHVMELDEVFKNFKQIMQNYDSELAFANTRSRLRMLTLYQIAQSNNGLVVGTGNKVEDFGIGFYTKYGDGGVDISPIADCTKTQVWEMGKELGIKKEIVEAKPTDGLWDDARNDEDQIGLSYPQIEEAMQNNKSQFYAKYLQIRKPNIHKMKSIPVCVLPKKL